MAKRRIKNNFKKWLIKCIPFFLIVFFVSFNIAFFFFNSSSYAKKLNVTEYGQMRKFSNDTGFDYVLRTFEKENLKEMIEIYKMEKDEYPLTLDAISGSLKNKNWIYTKQADRYILEYKNE